MFSYFLPHSSLSWGRHIIASVQSVFRVHLSLSPGVLVMAEPRSKLWVYFFSFKSLFSLKLLMVLSCESSHSSDIQFSLLFSQILSMLYSTITDTFDTFFFFFFARVSISGVYEFSVFLKPLLPRPATCSKLVGCSKDLTIDVTISLQFTFLPCGSFIFWIPFSLLLIYSLILVTVSSSRLFDTGEVVQLGIRLKVEVILRWDFVF